MKWLRARAAYLVLVVGMTLALAVGFSADRRSIARDVNTNRHDIARNCLTGQRSWDALSRVIIAAYNPGSDGTLNVDPNTLPPRTRQLLLDLAPLLKPSKNGHNPGEDHALEALGPRPACP